MDSIRTLTDDELILLEHDGLDSIEAQAKRMAGMARERAREALRKQAMHRGVEPEQEDESEDGNEGEEDDEDKRDVQMLIEELRRSTGVLSRTSRRGVEQKSGEGDLIVRRKRRRRRKSPDPYAKIPFYVAETMYAHRLCPIPYGSFRHVLCAVCSPSCPVP